MLKAYSLLLKIQVSPDDVETFPGTNLSLDDLSFAQGQDLINVGWWIIPGAGHRETQYVFIERLMYRWSSLLADSVFANLPPGKEVFVPSKFILVGPQSLLQDCACAERWELGVASGAHSS